eukprot:COSAG04_NODE_913_length_9463_cov_71.705575_11_plen_87_part_00
MDDDKVWAVVFRQQKKGARCPPASLPLPCALTPTRLRRGGARGGCRGGQRADDQPAGPHPPSPYPPPPPAPRAPPSPDAAGAARAR